MSKISPNGNMSFKGNLGAEVSTLFPELTNKSIEKLNQIGFPNRKTEDWRYTRTSSLLKKTYQKAGASEE